MAKHKDRGARFGLSDVRERSPLQLVGDHQDGFPRLLLMDPDLTPTDKIVWHFIRIHLNPMSTDNTIPAYDSITNGLNLSRATVATAIAALRVTRWLCVTDQLRNDRGNRIGSACTVHTRPATIGEAVELDAGYIAFLERCNQKTRSKLLRRLVANALSDVCESPQSVPGDLTSISPTNYLVQRTRDQQEADKFIREIVTQRNRRNRTGVQLFGRQIGAMRDYGADQAGENPLVQNLNLGISETFLVENSTKNPKFKNFFHEQTCSSSLYKNTTTTLLNKNLNKFHQGESTEKKKNSHESFEIRGLGGVGAGGPTWPTLKTDPDQANASPPLHLFEDLLEWDEREKKMIAAEIRNVPVELRQVVLDETVGMVQYRKTTPKPVADNLAYFRGVVRAACDGTLRHSSSGIAMGRWRERQAGAQDRAIKKAIDNNLRDQRHWLKMQQLAKERGDPEGIQSTQGILDNLANSLVQIKAGQLDA